MYYSRTCTYISFKIQRETKTLQHLKPPYNTRLSTRQETAQYPCVRTWYAEKRGEKRCYDDDRKHTACNHRHKRRPRGTSTAYEGQAPPTRDKRRRRGTSAAHAGQAPPTRDKSGPRVTSTITQHISPLAPNEENSSSDSLKLIPCSDVC